MAASLSNKLGLEAGCASAADGDTSAARKCPVPVQGVGTQLGMSEGSFSAPLSMLDAWSAAWSMAGGMPGGVPRAKRGEAHEV